MPVKSAHFEFRYQCMQMPLRLNYWNIWSTSTLWKYRKYRLEFVGTLDILCYTLEISEDLNYYKCVKKFIENWIFSSGFNQNLVLQGQVKIYFIL